MPPRRRRHYRSITIEGYKAIDLRTRSELLKLLADPTRVRLIALLAREELSVAELSTVTGLAQPRVSTHLGKLKEAGWVSDRRLGVSAYYRAPLESLDRFDRELWQALLTGTQDPLLALDAERLEAVLAARQSGEAWADRVAGDMERHYSPGRTWETLLRAFTQLLELGDVLDLASGDGVVAELIADRVRTLTCVDISPKVVAAGRQRLAGRGHVRFLEADMHALPLTEAQFDWVLMLQALAYSHDPVRVLSEARRVLRPGGRILATVLKAHAQSGEVAIYGHRNSGFTDTSLRASLERAGLRAVRLSPAGRERRPPHFESLVLIAERP